MSHDGQLRSPGAALTVNAEPNSACRVNVIDEMLFRHRFAQLSDHHEVELVAPHVERNAKTRESSTAIERSGPRCGGQLPGGSAGATDATAAGLA